MSQIPRRTTLSMTQPPKVRKTPTASPTASQPIVSKRQPGTPTDASPAKTIETETPIVIEDDFGDSTDNLNLVQVLSSVEEKHGLSPKAESTPQEERKNGKDSPVVPANTNGSGRVKELGKRPKATKKTPTADGVQDTDDTQSTSTSIRSSVESSTPLEMESLLIPEDDDVVGSAAEKSVSSYDSPRPNKTPGKVVRLAKGLRVSPFRKAELDNVSTIVNLSTVSEQSVEHNLDSPAVPAEKNGTPEGEVTSASTEAPSSRRISARRTYATHRPLREMSFRNATREAYRKNGTSEEGSNDGETVANDSVNATVGSELGFNLDDLPETPAGVQKRRRDSSDAEDGEAAPPEPKKSFIQSYCAVM